MKRYRYLTVNKRTLTTKSSSFIDEISIDQDKLNLIGSEGWELICSTETQMIFKKEDD